MSEHLEYVIICHDDESRYTLATRQIFPTRRLADDYVATLSPTRLPLVVDGAWHQLRCAAKPQTPRHFGAKGKHV